MSFKGQKKADPKKGVESADGTNAFQSVNNFGNRLKRTTWTRHENVLLYVLLSR